ncbi:hypothetical protein [Oceanisphaera sp. IT1-181]|uniref:hypothetical protein n=1 Tax=Oceanisphaera sp. IT1-181 TaxID=3081199 RepID=UPI0029CA37BD|nr:hypothetical protein [Oceanisphaera sp. IT1-181]
MSDNKAAWRHFYAAEKAFYAFLEQSCTEAVFGEYPAYSEHRTANGALLTRPPRFVRSIIVVPTALKRELMEQIQHLQEAFFAAAPEGKLPVRWPSVYHGVEQVNISVNTAHSSKAVVPGEALRLKTAQWPKEKAAQAALLAQFTLEQQALIAWGLSSAAIDEALEIGRFGQPAIVLTLTVDSQELLEVTGCANIQARKFTGSQYRARIRRVGESAGTRVKLGLMVLLGNDSPQVVTATPQAPRPHQLSATATAIELPIEAEFTFFGRG